MECKLSIENDKLLKQLEEEKKQVQYWRKESDVIYKRNLQWCDDVIEKIDNMENKFLPYGTSSGRLNLENRIFAIFKHYEELLSINNEKPILGQCGEFCCRQHLSSLWKYCPNCGVRIYSNEDKKKKFDRITKRLSDLGIEFRITKFGEPVMIHKSIYKGEDILRTAIWNTEGLKVIVEFVEEFNGARLSVVSDQFRKLLNEMKK